MEDNRPEVYEGGWGMFPKIPDFDSKKAIKIFLVDENLVGCLLKILQA